MFRAGTTLRFSPTDLVKFASCPHITWLDRRALDDPDLASTAVPDAPEAELWAQRGLAHESAYKDKLTAELGHVADLAKRPAVSPDLLREGHPALFQARLSNGQWEGHADFLLRVPIPSALGNFSYEIADTKLARSTRASFLIQLCVYADLLAGVQGRLPDHVQVVLGNGQHKRFRVADYIWYVRHLASRFIAWVESLELVGADNAVAPSRPQRCEACDTCRWRDACELEWESKGHLNRVANITRLQIHRLEKAGVDSIQGLATLPPSAVIPDIVPETVARLAQQAALQLQSQATGLPVHAILPLEPGRGFERLPPAHAGDLYFDMEGDPLEPGGLEYLFGLSWMDGGQPQFKPFWAHDRAAEKQAFEAFIDTVDAHLRRHPEAHIYHYAAYERTALQRLMSTHGAREQAMDDLLRKRKLVDLYAVVREGLRVGERSYSIKALERHYGRRRDGEVQTAGASIVMYERWRLSREQPVLDAIEAYNRDDVDSTRELHAWLLAQRPAGANWMPVVPWVDIGSAELGNAVAAQRHKAGKTSAPTGTPNPRRLQLDQRREALLAALPSDRSAWSPADHQQELLALLLDFHRRCDKPVWWAMFDRQLASDDELIDDADCLGGLVPMGTAQPVKRSWRHSFRFPPQLTKLQTGASAAIVSDMKAVRDLVVDEDRNVVSFTSGLQHLTPPRVALGPVQPISNEALEDALLRFTEPQALATERYRAGLCLLRRERPSIDGKVSGEPLTLPGEELTDATTRAVMGLQQSVLFVQGPPGAGKTFTASRVILALIRAGRRVGVTSNSHNAINNLLRAVTAAARDQRLTFRGGKASNKPDQHFGGPLIEDFQAAVLVAELPHLQLVAGTAWLFARPALDQQIDTLLVDEAGQVSLANLLAISTSARNLVLLGDPQQLAQPVQGVHPGESGQSSLDYLLQGAATVAADRGIFLQDSWRMHPVVCSFISALAYEERLRARPENARQVLSLTYGAHTLLKPSGIVFAPVNHDGCSQRSAEEAALIATLVTSLLAQHFVDKAGTRKPMTLENILVVAPYNAQVAELKRALPASDRVGTVDKFQGQEAEVVLVSMTTSSAEFLPRDIAFLFSRNRLNVALSRAKSLAVVVASKRLLDVPCRNADEIGLVNGICRVQEASSLA